MEEARRMGKPNHISVWDFTKFLFHKFRLLFSQVFLIAVWFITSKYFQIRVFPKHKLFLSTDFIDSFYDLRQKGLKIGSDLGVFCLVNNTCFMVTVEIISRGFCKVYYEGGYRLTVRCFSFDKVSNTQTPLLYGILHWRSTKYIMTMTIEKPSHRTLNLFLVSPDPLV